MERVKGSKNKSSIEAPHLSSEERLKIFANLIVDRIIETQKSGALPPDFIKK